MNARDLIGSPFLLDGASPAGFDCWGLVEFARREAFGLDTPIVPPDGSGPGAAMHAITATLKRGAWREVRPPGAPGDVVGMARVGRGPLHHVGVVIEGGVLHAFAGDRGSGSVVLSTFERLATYFHQLQVFRWPN